jgi:ribosomal protein L7/L12/DNA-binding beta-propeller fold protein YncE
VSQNLKCPSCGASLDFDPGSNLIIRCPYCNSSVVVPQELRSAPAGYPPSVPGGVVWPESFFQPAQIAQIQEISRLVHQKKKIEAIKLYREVFGVGLKEAKDGVEKLERGQAVTLSYAQSTPVDPAQVEAEIRRLLQARDKVEAVKYYRQVSGRGLKESKEAVEHFERTGSLPDWAGAGLDGESGLLATSLLQANQMIAIVELVQAGQEHAAVKAYQEAFGASLDEAQDAVHKISLGVTPGAPVYSVQTIQVDGISQDAAVAAAGTIGGISCLGVLGIITLVLLIVVPVMFAFASPGGPLEGVWNRINPFAYARVIFAFGEEGLGPGLLDDPREIAIDPAGNLFIANYSDGRVQQFDAQGSYLLLWNIGSESYPSGMAADRAGNVALVFHGELWKYAGDSGQELGRLDEGFDTWFEAVAAHPEGGFVAAANSQQVIRYNARGEPVFSLAGAPGVHGGDPDDVEDLTVDGTGNLYLLSGDEEAVLVYSPQGQLLRRFGGPGDEPGQLRVPSAIEVDGQGNLYISDIKGIQVFSNDGRYLDKIEVEGFAFDLAFDLQGNLWVLSSQPKVFQYQITGR